MLRHFALCAPIRMYLIESLGDQGLTAKNVRNSEYCLVSLLLRCGSIKPGCVFTHAKSETRMICYSTKYGNLHVCIEVMRGIGHSSKLTQSCPIHCAIHIEQKLRKNGFSV